jgi:hypothetical protein
MAQSGIEPAIIRLVAQCLNVAILVLVEKIMEALVNVSVA